MPPRNSIHNVVKSNIFNEPIGELVITEMPLKLIIINLKTVEVIRRTYREIVKQVIIQYAKFRPSHGDIRLDPIFDETHDRYALMQVGWDRGRRVRGNLIYAALQNGKVYVEYDGIEHGITKDLIAMGITPPDIVLAFLSESELAASA